MKDKEDVINELSDENVKLTKEPPEVTTLATEQGRQVEWGLNGGLERGRINSIMVGRINTSRFGYKLTNAILESEGDINLPDSEVMDKAVDDYLGETRSYFPPIPGETNPTKEMDLELHLDLETYPSGEEYGDHLSRVIEETKNHLIASGVPFTDEGERIVILHDHAQRKPLVAGEDPFDKLNERIDKIKNDFTDLRGRWLKGIGEMKELDKTKRAAITGRRSDKSYIPPHQLNKTNRSKKGKRK